MKTKLFGFFGKRKKSRSTVAEVCKQYGISEQTYYRWTNKYSQMEVPDVRRLRELEKDNVRLKRMVAERDLEIDAMQEVLRRN